MKEKLVYGCFAIKMSFELFAEEKNLFSLRVK